MITSLIVNLRAILSPMINVYHSYILVANQRPNSSLSVWHFFIPWCLARKVFNLWAFIRPCFDGLTFHVWYDFAAFDVSKWIPTICRGYRRKSSTLRRRPRTPKHCRSKVRFWRLDTILYLKLLRRSFSSLVCFVVRILAGWLSNFRVCLCPLALDYFLSCIRPCYIIGYS